VRNWPAPALDIDRHKGYAFQWYALAADGRFYSL
jgi:surfeit locus 1 family protein